jgi:hypothetical protein
MVTTKKAGSKKATSSSGQVTTGKTLTLTAGRNAKFLTIAVQLEKAFKRGGCPGCRSGVDRIVFQDQVLTNVR